MLSFYKYIVRLFTKRHENDSDATPSAYKIYFNLMERIIAKTPLQTGVLTLGESGFEITGDTLLRIPFSDITSLRLEFPHSSAALSHLIEIKYRPNGILYFGVLRFALFKFFVISNLFQTIALFEKIKKNVPQNLA